MTPCYYTLISVPDFFIFVHLEKKKIKCNGCGFRFHLEELEALRRIFDSKMFVFFLFFFFKILLDRGPFCGATVTLCFPLRMTLPMSFKVRVDQSLPALFFHLHAMIPRVISGCWDQALNLDHSPQRRAQYHCASLTQLKKMFVL